ncbi:MAG: hypothetical protein ACI936_003279 [Paraglaciecola sp.]|jgi:hypothetical protein
MNQALRWYLLLLFSYIHLNVHAEEQVQDLHKVVEEVTVKKINELLGGKAPFVELKYFTPDSDNTSASGYGLAYDWERKANTSLKISHDLSQFSSNTFSAYAKGNFIFADKNNPEDLSKAGLSYEYITANYAPILKNEVLTGSLGERYQEECFKGFDTKSDWCQATSDSLNNISSGDTSTIWSFKLKADVQGNQDYTEKAYVYGLGVGFKHTPAIDSPIRLLNIFELPFRYITQPLLNYNESGYSDRSFPVINVGIDRVNPSDNTIRNTILPDKNNYERAYAEIGYVTTIGKFKGQSIKFNFHYRYFKEIDADLAIKDAGLDRFHYAVYAIQIPGIAFNLDIPQVITLSYSTGKLPFNLSSEAIFQIGFKSNVELGKVFGLD